MHTRAMLIAALLAALGLSASSAFASTASSEASWTAGVGAGTLTGFDLIASSGRGKDGDKQEDDGADAPDDDEDVNLPGCDVPGRGDICV